MDEGSHSLMLYIFKYFYFQLGFYYNIYSLFWMFLARIYIIK